MAMNEPLKTCPFCGGAAFIRKVGNERSKKRGWDIGCKPCYYNMSQRVLRYDHEWLWPKMVESWNTRAPDQSTQPDEAELVRIVLGMLDMYYRADTRPIWIDTQAADIITALRPYLQPDQSARVKELEAAFKDGFYSSQKPLPMATKIDTWQLAWNVSDTRKALKGETK